MVQFDHLRGGGRKKMLLLTLLKRGKHAILLPHQCSHTDAFDYFRVPCSNTLYLDSLQGGSTK